jgi:hypothetical protein
VEGCPAASDKDQVLLCGPRIDGGRFIIGTNYFWNGLSASSVHYAVGCPDSQHVEMALDDPDTATALFLHQEFARPGFRRLLGRRFAVCGGGRSEE